MHGYCYWKESIQFFLLEQDLWGIVTQSEKAPTDATQLATSNSKDSRALGIIGTNLSADLISLV